MFPFLRTQFTFFILATIITGVAYPALVTIIAQTCFPDQANGSLVYHEDVVIGSRLIGQEFASADYFRGRPSATADRPYNAVASGGSNLGPSNPKLIEAVESRRSLLDAGLGSQQADIQKGRVPVDLVTSSASGLDPDISLAAALYQISRVAKARNLDENELKSLVTRHTQPRQFGLLGEPRVNVLALNMDLDVLTSKTAAIDP